jgi:S-formylglutathione hydrolase FrmB
MFVHRSLVNNLKNNKLLFYRKNSGFSPKQPNPAPNNSIWVLIFLSYLTYNSNN